MLFWQGKDPSLGMTVLGKINSLREEGDAATYDVSLFRGVPQLLVTGCEPVSTAPPSAARQSENAVQVPADAAT